MTAKEELLKFIFDNEFITKPRLKNDFELLVNKVIDEAQQQVKNLNIPAFRYHYYGLIPSASHSVAPILNRDVQALLK